MRIQTLNADYEVIQILRKDVRKDVLLVKKADLSNTEKYMFVIIKQKKDIRLFLSFCADLKQNMSFDDFLDFFPKDGQLYMLFKYYDSRTIEERAFAESISLKEKLSITRNLIQRMIFLNVPVYLMYETLDRRNLRVDENGMVYFNYHLYDVEKFGNITLQDIWERLYLLLIRLFEKELYDKSCPCLEEWLEQLQMKKHESYMELMQTYEPVYKNLMEIDQKNEIKPYRMEFRIWDWIKSKFVYLKYIAMAAVAAGLIWFLADTILHPEYPEADVFNYVSIGTLELKEQPQNENETE